ncbi:MAG: MltA domain-containing protein, partial [Rhodocyclaceae bacterium]|nr:MltA domain-containing protein [Rhodocyclaceae bacterium]
MTMRQIPCYLLCALALAACTTGGPQAPQEAPRPAQCPPCPGAQVQPPPAAAPLRRVSWDDLPGWGEDDPAPALEAFIASCRALARKPDWTAACTEAELHRGGPRAELAQFFMTRFEPFQVVNPDASTEGLITGYYEPLLRADRKAGGAYRYPIYGVPDDLIVVDLAEVHPELKSMRLRGRLQGRRLVPYFTRAEIAAQPDKYAQSALFWAEDAMDVVFLQVQGSGRVELPDGSRVRVGYADQNGMPYASIGRWLIDQGEMRADAVSMQGIREWARANPSRLPDLLKADPSFVFFRVLSGLRDDEGPPGALGVPLTGGRSVAVDARTIPLGAMVWLDAPGPGNEGR